MSDGSRIEWLQRPGTRGATWNPVVGCRKVSAGCTNCYAMGTARRVAAAADALAARGGTPSPRMRAYAGVVRRDGEARPLPQWNGRVVCVESALEEPLRWREPRTVFVNSQGDLFHEAVHFSFIVRVFAVMAMRPQHTFVVLTKRPRGMVEILRQMGRSPAELVREAARLSGPPPRLGDLSMPSKAGILEGLMGGWRWPLPNVWVGVSAESQATLEDRVLHLARIPAAVRLVSLEPLIDEVDVSPFLRSDGARRRLSAEPVLHWVIAGGESGAHSRPCDVLWLRAIIDQCRAAGVPLFVKQLGSRPMLGDLNDPHGWPTEGGPVDWETGRIALRDPKGADWAEWPEALRVRQWPQVGATVEQWASRAVRVVEDPV